MLSQFNRTAKGWVIELVNNNGVVKFPTTPPVVDPDAVARVALHPHEPQQGVFDWRTGAQLTSADGYQVEIGPGQTAFIEWVCP